MIWVKNCWDGVKQQSLNHSFYEHHNILICKIMDHKNMCALTVIPRSYLMLHPIICSIWKTYLEWAYNSHNNLSWPTMAWKQVQSTGFIYRWLLISQNRLPVASNCSPVQLLHNLLDCIFCVSRWKQIAIFGTIFQNKKDRDSPCNDILNYAEKVQLIVKGACTKIIIFVNVA